MTLILHLTKYSEKTPYITTLVVTNLILNFVLTGFLLNNSWYLGFSTSNVSLGQGNGSQGEDEDDDEVATFSFSHLEI